MPNLLKTVVLLTAVSFIAASTEPFHEKFVVHEWGVQVLGHAHQSPLLSPPGELIAGLPKFVGRGQPLRYQLFGWDKPVIHLYGPEGTEVSVKVQTPLGLPLAYYPIPNLESGKTWGSSAKVMSSGWLRYDFDMQWSGKLRRAAPTNLPDVLADHWWHTAREIPSAYFQTAKGSERFLFYEATAAQAPVITATIDQRAITLKNDYKEVFGPVVILANDGTGLRGVTKKWIPPGHPVHCPESELRPWTEAEALEAFRRQWIALGMSTAEATAIVSIWKTDLVNRLGVLVVSPMPREIYDRMFPITISPRPDELVRAGLVFDTLAGQGKRLNWLPGLSATLHKKSHGLTDADPKIRKRSESAFLMAGDLALSILETLGMREARLAVIARELDVRIRASQKARAKTARPTKGNAAQMVEAFETPPPKLRRRK